MSLDDVTIVITSLRSWCTGDTTTTREGAGTRIDHTLR